MRNSESAKTQETRCQVWATRPESTTAPASEDPLPQQLCPVFHRSLCSLRQHDVQDSQGDQHPEILQNQLD